MKNRSRPVCDHVGNHRSPLSAISLIAILDDFLAALRFKVDIYVGRSAAFSRKKPLKWQVEPDWVNPGETDASAYGRVGSGTSDLAVDVLGAGKLHDVPGNQEEAGKPEITNHPKLVIKPRPGSWINPPILARVDVTRPFHRKVRQILEFSGEGPRHGEIGEVRCNQVEIER